MISCIQGKIISIAEQSIIVDVHGIGFHVYVPSSHSFSLENVVVLHTYLHWNSELGPTLFGFNSSVEKKIFELVISCSGVGPKLALAVLRDLGVAEFLHAVSVQDIRSLSKVSGIGQKKAEQIAVYLKDKVNKFILSEKMVDTQSTTQTMHLKEVSDALSSLGYSRQEVTHAMTYLHEQPDQHQYLFDQMFRKALAFLSRNN